MNINAYACILYYEQGIEKKMMIINMLKYCLYCKQGIFYSQFIFPQIVFKMVFTLYRYICNVYKDEFKISEIF